jgi:hypothetical protein
MKNRIVVSVGALALVACMGPVDNVLHTPGSGSSPTPSKAFGDAGCGFGSPDESMPVMPAKEPPAISGGTMCVASDGTAVIGDSDRDVIYVVGPTATAPHVISLQSGDEPGRAILGPGTHAFVALRGAGQVAEIDIGSATLVARHDACPAPRGIAFDGATLYVACVSGDLLKLTYSAQGITARSSVYVADDLRDVVLVSNGALVSTFRTATVYKVPASGPVSVFMTPGAETDFVPRVAWRMVAGPTGVVMVHQEALSSPIQDAACAAYGDSQTNLSAVATRVAQITDANGAISGTQLMPDTSIGAVLPVDVAVSSDGRWTAVAAAGSSQLVVSQAGGSQSNPSAVGITSVAWNGTSLFTFSREPAVLQIWDVGTSNVVRRVSLSDTSVESTGHRTFHTETPAGLACASCHPEAGDDGNTWQLPEGTRRTPSLRGGLSGTEPFHWSGDEADMNMLVQDILVHRMAGDPQTVPHVNALMHWLDAQPVRSPPQLDAAAVGRGQATFESSQASCTTCHTGAVGTNNSTVDVGTGGAFQVPRLVELAYRAPFMHDGRAATLADRFGTAGGNAHGNTSQLSADQLNDLITYLRSR